MTRARRPNLYVVAALTKRYARAKGQLGDLLADREAIKADLAHLGAVLAMFEPGIDLVGIPPTRPYKPARGRWNRTAMEALRKANHPLKAFELARMVMSQPGVDRIGARSTRLATACRRCWRGYRRKGLWRRPGSRGGGRLRVFDGREASRLAAASCCGISLFAGQSSPR
jgi:hypothetical protein